MIHGISVSFSPIGPWPLLIGAIVAVTVLTLWAYRGGCRGTSGRWRWFALSLRLLAILLCLLAALRPSVMLKEKKKQAASLVYLVDTSTSMIIGDEVRGQSRWDVANAGHQAGARSSPRPSGPTSTLRFYRFDSDARPSPRRTSSAKLPKPKGRETDAGPGDARGPEAAGEYVPADRPAGDPLRFRLQQRHRSPGGRPPAEGAGRARWSPWAWEPRTPAPVHRDITLRDIVTSPTVFVKNQLEVRGNLVARGFANQTLDVELLRRGPGDAVAKTQVKVPDGADVDPDHRAEVHPADARREDGSRSRSLPRTASWWSRTTRSARLSRSERRLERPVPPGLELHLGLSVT